MSDDTLPPLESHQDDDELLADIAEALQEREADRLIAALIAAEEATADPDLMAALDAAAQAHDEVRGTWYADLASGDLPNDQALTVAREVRKDARNRMYGIIGVAGDPPWPGAGRRREYDALLDAATALHAFVLDSDDLAEYVAYELGPRGPRYALGH